MEKKNKIRVVHIIPTLAFGGAERFVVDLVNHGDPENFSYTIIVLKPIWPLREQIVVDCPVELVLKRGKLGWGLIRALRVKLQELNPDIVHTHLFGGDIWGRLAARSLGLPIVTTEHNVNVGDGWWRNQIKRILSRYSQAYAAPSQAIIEYLRTQYGWIGETQKIRYGIDVDHYSLVPDLDWETPPDRLLMLGRLTKQKNHLFLLQVLAGLQTYSWTLTIVGEGEDQKKILKKVEELGLSDRVRMHSGTTNVRQVLAGQQVVLMPSAWEGLGIVAMEAMAAGRLVVASAVDGLKEVLIDGQDGWLLPVNEKKIWQERLVALLSGKEKVGKIVERAKEKARKEFGFGPMVEAYETLYQEVLVKGAPEKKI